VIEKLTLGGIATFSLQTVMSPKQINFCYGSNGSGKTTIAKAIAAPSQDGVHIAWADQSPLQTLVYDRDFVSANFAETSSLGGIFTLGEDSKEAQEFIAEQQKEVARYAREIEITIKTKEIFEQEQCTRDIQLSEECWNVLSKFKKEFAGVFKGSIGSKVAFRDNCLKAYEHFKGRFVRSEIEELKRLYSIAYGASQQQYRLYELINGERIQTQESCNLLAEVITGSTDTPMGQLIAFLQNSDWVKQGLTYLGLIDSKCPFCQQALSETLQENLAKFFDEAYEQSCTALKLFHEQYSSFARDLLHQLNAILEVPYPIPGLEYALFRSETVAIEALFETNIRLINEKIAAPSTKIVLHTLKDIASRINAILTEFNEKIRSNNSIVANQAAKQKECKSLIWQLLLSELDARIVNYLNDTAKCSKGIEGLSQKFQTLEANKKEALRLISEKESTITSVKPTAEKINDILLKIGFEGFRIEENPLQKGTYRIVRADGKNVGRTLSEGEYNFITFLYFYHLVYGSQANTGISRDKVVVIDDPISSLDSNVLFVVSTLTKDIIDDCLSYRNGIQQVFVLTHNIYFHKEITYRGGRRDSWPKEVAFWVIKKRDNISLIIPHEKNPIQTSYELLWSELRESECSNRITIFNTMRRALEYYFNMIGGMDYEKECLVKFEGNEKVLCRALMSCINDGSHCISDDFVVQLDDEFIAGCLRIFPMIWEKLGHAGHYNMMMGIEHPI